MCKKILILSSSARKGGNSDSLADEFIRGAQINGRRTAELHYARPDPFETPDKTVVGHPCWSIARKPDAYHVILDTHGKLQYEGDSIYDVPAVTVVSEFAPKAYLDYLGGKGISWIAAGKDRIDLATALRILHDEFGILIAVFTGGGNVNGAFLEAGPIDEVIMPFNPGIDGRKGWAAAFDGIGNQDFGPVKLTLTAVKQFENGTVELRYKI